jgi:hypothetical protein
MQVLLPTVLDIPRGAVTVNVMLQKAQYVVDHHV